MMRWLALFLSLQAAPAASAAEIDPKWLACEKASDCAHVPITNCGCSDGKARAVNKNFAEDFAASEKPREPGGCAGAMSSDWTCVRYKVSCVKKKCALEERAK